MPFARRRDIHVPWMDVVVVEQGRIHLAIVGRSRAVATRVPADVSRLRRVPLREDWSFAQVLVAYKPDTYVLTDPVLNGQPCGARQRTPSEPASLVEPVPLTRAPQVRMAFFMATIFVVGLLRAFLSP